MDPFVIGTVLATNAATFGLTYLLCSKGSKRFNTTIDIDSKKVATIVSPEEISKKVEETGKPIAYCRCWKSKKFPLCDGSHNKYNNEAGDNLGPLVIKK
mmetsp:Transcript_21044/g.40772  ORF Transcript_21044/g.40772 Transcript_21044/m.40772 type:complete len:99 (+) Transcript_21044:54-350(+)